MASKFKKIGIVGLGYVGLPLALALSKKNSVVGFDVNKKRINSLKKGLDHTGEVSKNDILNSKKIELSDNNFDLSECKIYIITVPTPVNKNNNPDLNHLKSASKIGKKAGERAVARINSKKIKSCNVDVIFEPRIEK